MISVIVRPIPGVYQFHQIHLTRWSRSSTLSSFQYTETPTPPPESERFFGHPTIIQYPPSILVVEPFSIGVLWVLLSFGTQTIHEDLEVSDDFYKYV